MHETNHLAVSYKLTRRLSLPSIDPLYLHFTSTARKNGKGNWRNGGGVPDPSNFQEASQNIMNEHKTKDSKGKERGSFLQFV